MLKLPDSEELRAKRFKERAIDHLAPCNKGDKSTEKSKKQIEEWLNGEKFVTPIILEGNGQCNQCFKPMEMFRKDRRFCSPNCGFQWHSNKRYERAKAKKAEKAAELLNNLTDKV